MLGSLVILAVLAADPAAERATGGVVAPAFLPAGSNALYAFVGAPDLGVGYRQGFGTVEFEARASFNLFEVSAIGDVGVRLGVLHRDRLKLAPTLGVGIEFDSGSRYFDRYNFGFIGLRPRVGVNGSYAFSEIVSGVAQLDVPVSIALTVQGFQVTPLFGLGGEFHLGGGFSLALTGHVGFDATREPLGVAQYRPAWAVRLGVGYRLF